ncbi:MAG TPA: hypothetical protein VG347_15125 [Verrucomicrobiae bacterium]|nr:hypothetical protein [Verrucomicrobiae bacterium]
MWTLQYFGPGGTVEKRISAAPNIPSWGLLGTCPFQFHNTSKSSLDLVTGDDFDNALVFGFRMPVTIWRERTFAGGNFGAGSIWFQGFISEPNREAPDAKQNHRYTVFNWIWRAENIGFRQPWSFKSGGTYAAPNFVTQYSDEVVLGETQNEFAQDAGAQIREILTSMNQRYNPTRWRSFAGAVDVSKDLVKIGSIGINVAMPPTPAKCISCYEALRECMKWAPDAVLWTDYTTSPVTVNVTKLADMGSASVTLPGADANNKFPGIALKPCYDRQLNGVIIQYKMPVSVGGTTFLGLAFDQYPPICDPDDPDVISFLVQLAGSKVNVSRTTVTTTIVNAAAGDNATRLGWWQQRDDRLKNVNLSNLIIDPTSVVCTDYFTGAFVDFSALPFQLIASSGGPLPGMGVITRDVTITATASWTRVDPSTNAPVETVVENIHVRLTICNLDTGGVSQSYRVETDAELGEVAPVGLAQNYYVAVADLQYEGVLNTKGKEIRGDLTLGEKLTIITPRGNYANNIIQSLSGNLMNGVLDVQIGPPTVMGPADRIEQMRAARYIRGNELPSGRSNGGATGSSTVDMTSAGGKENTVPGHKLPSLHAVVGNYGGIHSAVSHDASLVAAGDALN